jgi:hypothetical protein
MADHHHTKPQHAFSRGSLAQALLPPPFAEQAREVEPARFDALVEAMTAEWNESCGTPSNLRVEDSLRWVSLVNWCARRTRCDAASRAAGRCAGRCPRARRVARLSRGV